MNPTQILSGLALIGEELALRPVDIVIDKGRITAIDERTRAPRSGSARRFLTPILTLPILSPWTAGVLAIWTVW